MTDHDLLVKTHAMVEEIHKAVFGNSRSGLVERVTTLEAYGRKGRLVAGGVGGVGVTILGTIALVVQKVL